MQMESGTINIIMIGFFMVIGLCLIVIFKLYLKYKDKSLFWFIGQSFFIILAFFKFTDLIQHKPQIPEVMLSEEN